MHDYILNLGIRIKKVRGALSQPKFAAKLQSDVFSVTPQSVMNYEKGHRVPPIELLIRIVEVFGVDGAWLVFGERNTKEGEFITPDWVPPDGIDFFEQLMLVMKNSPYMFYDIMRRWPKIKKANQLIVNPILEANRKLQPDHKENTA